MWFAEQYVGIQIRSAPSLMPWSTAWTFSPPTGLLSGTPEIVFGAWSFVPVPQASILAMRYDWGARSILVIHNLAAKGVTTSFKLDPPPGPGGLIDLLGEGEFSCGKDGNVKIEVAGYVQNQFRMDLHGDVLEGHLSSALCHLGNIAYRLGRVRHCAVCGGRVDCAVMT